MDMSDDATSKTKSPLAGLNLTFLAPAEGAQTAPAAPPSQTGDGKSADVSVVIVGSGPAGLPAAIYAARANLEPVVIGGIAGGGQLMLTTDVEKYACFRDGVAGRELRVLLR